MRGSGDEEAIRRWGLGVGGWEGRPFPDPTPNAQPPTPIAPVHLHPAPRPLSPLPHPIPLRALQLAEEAGRGLRLSPRALAGAAAVGELHARGDAAAVRPFPAEQHFSHPR